MRYSKDIHPRLNFINLAVDELDRSLTFYRDDLGLPTRGVVGSEFHDQLTGATGTIIFFELQGGLMFGLYERANLAKDAARLLMFPLPLSSVLGMPSKPKQK